MVNKGNNTHIVRCLSHNILFPFFRNDKDVCNSTEEEQLIYRKESEKYVDSLNQVSANYGVAYEVIGLSKEFDYILDRYTNQLEWCGSDFEHRYALMIYMESYDKVFDLFKDIQGIDLSYPTNVIICKDSGVFDDIVSNKDRYNNYIRALIDDDSISSEYSVYLNKDYSNKDEFINEISMSDSVLLAYEGVFRNNTFIFNKYAINKK